MRAQAGAATADITPPVGEPMGGYGRRTAPSAGVMHPLLVRALVLTDGNIELAIGVCDLLGVGSDLVTQARERVEQATGIPREHVLIAATHTHGGPARLRAAEDATYVEATARTIAGAITVAQHRVAPAILKYGSVDVGTISQNRRDPEGPTQRTAHVLLVDGAIAEGPPIATLVNFACHATVLESDNLYVSSDFPGATTRFVERELGGTALYLQGACGDVNPVWSRHDAAEVERVGGVLGAAATRLAHEMRPLGHGQWCLNLSWSEQIAVDCSGFVLDPVDLAVARTELDLPRRSRASRDEIDIELRRLETQLDAGLSARRHARAHINELETSRLFSGAPTGKPTQRLEVQAIRLSEQCAIATLPGEFFVETAQSIAERSGIPAVFIAGYANGSVGYVPPARAYELGGYEVGMTQFGPDAEPVIADAAVAALRSLYPPG